MSDVTAWDTSSSGNNSPSPNGFPENMAPAGLNDASREVMAAVRRAFESLGFLGSGGTTWAGNALNVKAYGAVGDGVTDDSAAIQAAIAFALSTSTIYPVYFPAGSYYVTTSLDINGTDEDRLLLYGDHRASDIWSDQAIDTIDLQGVATTFQYPTLVNLTVRNTNASGVAIRTRNTEFLHIDRCVIVGTNKGLLMSETGGESDIKPKITNSFFGSGAYGIQGGDTRVADAIIRDNFFLNQTTAAIEFGYLDGGVISGNGLFSDNGSANSCRGLNLKQPIYVDVRENRFFEVGGEAIKATSPRYSTFEANKIVGTGDNSNQNAIDIQDYDASTPGKGNKIRDNIIKDVEGHGVYINSTNSIQTNYDISGNEFEEVGKNAVIYDAINLTNTEATIRNNTIVGDSATRYWLNLDASTVKIGGNDFTSTVNSDLNRANSPAITVEPSGNIVTGVTATRTSTFDEDGVIFGTITGNITLNLHSATTCAAKRYSVRWTAGAFDITVDPSSAQTIDGSTTVTVNSGSTSLDIMSDGANWYTV